MELKYLKQCILNKQLPKMTILSGDEAFISIYVNQLYKTFDIKVLPNINSYFSLISNKFKLNTTNTIYLIYNDDSFKNNSSFWNMNIDKVVFIYKDLKKSEKFFKAFEKDIAFFDPLDEAYLKAIIKNRLNINQEDIDWIVQRCDSNYFKCLNEIEKVSIFNKEEHQTLFNHFKKEGLIGKKDTTGTYELVNAVSDKNKTLALELATKLPKDDKIGQLSLIYANLKNQLLVQGGNQTAEQLGISPKLYNVLSRKKKYSIEQLCNCLSVLADYMNKLKLGQLDVADAIYLFILTCM